MYRLYVTTLLVFVPVLSFLSLQQANAVGQDIVISQVQLGNSASVNNEFVQIYNNSLDDVDVTNWCLQYVRTSGSITKLACFDAKVTGSRVFMPGHSAVLAVSAEYANAATPVVGDISFSATLSGIGGYVRLLDDAESEVDKVGWGVSSLDFNLVAAAPNGSVMKRKPIDSNTIQDTDINGDDFEVVVSEPVFYGQIYEVPDTCPNLDDFQDILPDGYSLDGANCQPPVVDVCSNIDGMQATLPVGMEKLAGDCVSIDKCENILGIQPVLPAYFISPEIGKCQSNILPLQVSEILPNVAGVDDGNEFIEVYNPNNADINLDNYEFYIGPSYTKSYSFLPGQSVAAGQYTVFYNQEINFTLLNTSGSVRLQSVDGYLTNETAAYDSPIDDYAWALVDSVWQYTDQPSPGAANLPMSIDSHDELFVVSSLRACATNQYRSPETNRCRLIISGSATTLAACRDGQYRSEETNRCRNIASDISSSLPCAEGQERNPATNRCRSTASLAATELAPCKAGQERNPETNRCRNVSSMPIADYAPEQVKTGSDNKYIWLALAGVGLLAICYGAWEWRVEVVKLFRKIVRLKK